MSARVLLVDDHPMWLDVVEAALTGAGMDVVGRADTVKKALTIAPAVRPEVAVVDLNLPDGTGADVAAGLVRLVPGVKVLMLSASAEARDALKATKAGASGYLLKSAPAAELIRAVELTLKGEAVFTPALAGLVLGSLREESVLTEREVEILRLVAKGMTSKQVGERLFISTRTVENHVNSTLKKLHLNNRVELTRYAYEHGIE